MNQGDMLGTVSNIIGDYGIIITAEKKGYRFLNDGEFKEGCTVSFLPGSNNRHLIATNIKAFPTGGEVVNEQTQEK